MVVSKITMKNILIALESNYGKLEGMEVLERSGYSPDLYLRAGEIKIRASPQTAAGP